MTKAICQLATPIKADVQTFIEDDRWWFEPKLDGVRLLVHQPEDQEAPLVYQSRRGLDLNPPKKLSETLVYAPFPLDGELVNETYYVFDAVTGGDLRARREQLQDYYNDFRPPAMRLVPTARTSEDKARLYNAVKEAGGEGVVVKDSLATYTVGKSKTWLKVKFYATYDVIVSELNRKGKDEAISTRWADGSDAGGCKLVFSKQDGIEIGDVIEVRCLYLSDTNKLIQPVFVRKRYDKDPAECLPD